MHGEKNLFALNSYSTYLRTQISLTKLRLAAATSTGNTAAIATETAILNKLFIQQTKLDHLQKSILSTHQSYLKSEMTKIRLKTYQHFQKEKSHWQNHSLIQTQFNLSPHTQLAVTPDRLGGVAPNYELQNNYKTMQTLSFVLHMYFNVKLSNQKSNYKINCQVGIQNEGTKWQLVINQE